MSDPLYRVAVVGLGNQGAGIARLVVEQGHELAGAVDIGPKVGRPLVELLGVGPSTTVSGSVDELLASGVKVDVAVLAANIPAPDIVAQAKDFLARGVNVVTLHQDLFAPDDSWTPELHQVAVAGGSSFLAGGVQDTWWVQLPALAASSSVSISTVRIVSSPSLESLSEGLSRLIGVAQTPAEFEQTAGFMLAVPAVLGSSLAEAARRMGLVPLEMSKTFESIVSTEPYAWGVAGETIPAGNVIGTREVVSFDTDRGIRFEGVFQVTPVPVAEGVEELYIEGQPSLHLRYMPFPNDPITNTALLARVPDVIAAAPGVHFAADLPPARPFFPRRP